MLSIIVVSIVLLIALAESLWGEKAQAIGWLIVAHCNAILHVVIAILDKLA